MVQDALAPDPPTYARSDNTTDHYANGDTEGAASGAYTCAQFNASLTHCDHYSHANSGTGYATANSAGYFRIGRHNLFLLYNRM